MSSPVSDRSIPDWVWPLHYSSAETDDSYVESYDDICRIFKGNPKLYQAPERMEFIRAALKSSYTPGQLVVMKEAIDGLVTEDALCTFLRNRIRAGFLPEKVNEKYKLMALYSFLFVPIYP